MPSFLALITRAGNLMSHHLDDRITELGIGTQEYLLLRTAFLNPDASSAEIRRFLASRDAAFSDVVRRSLHRGYARELRYPRDRRTRRIGLTVPGEQALRIASSIHLEIEAAIATGPSRADALDHLDRIGRHLAAYPRAERYADGLPLATA